MKIKHVTKKRETIIRYGIIRYSQLLFELHYQQERRYCATVPLVLSG